MAGRPIDYKPEYCARVIELGELGYSVVEMCADIGVARDTLDKNWPAANPEFLAAMTQAKLKSQAWWERQGRESLLIAPGMGTFQASVWSRSMAARFPADWREKQEQEHTGSVNMVHKIERKVIDPREDAKS